MIVREAVTLEKSDSVGYEAQCKSRGGAGPEWMGDEGSRQFGGEER